MGVRCQVLGFRIRGLGLRVPRGFWGFGVRVGLRVWGSALRASGGEFRKFPRSTAKLESREHLEHDVVLLQVCDSSFPVLPDPQSATGSVLVVRSQVGARSAVQDTPKTPTPDPAPCRWGCGRILDPRLIVPGDVGECVLMTSRGHGWPPPRHSSKPRRGSSRGRAAH